MSGSIEKINGITYLVAELDASKAVSYRKLYVHLAEMFQFPETQSIAYEDVLMDYMTDLAWLPQKNFKIIVRNQRKINNRQKILAELRDSLETIRKYWENKKTRNERDWENNFLVEFVD